MPYYRIHLHYTDDSTRTCLRQHPAYDIEFVNRYFMVQLKKSNKGMLIQELEAVMVSKNAQEVKNISTARSGEANNFPFYFT